MARPTIISSVFVPAATQTQGQPLDLISLADVKLELNITERTDDAWLAKVITRASRSIATECSRVFQVQTYQEQFWQLRDPYPWQLPSRTMPLQLSAWPLASPPSPAGTTPPLSPTLSAGSGGALAAGTVYVRLTYVTANGETAASQEASVIVAANGSVQIATPIPDFYGIAAGWNCYAGLKSFGEVLQNSAPLTLGQNFTIDALRAPPAYNQAPPNYILVVENSPSSPQPLAEGLDFLSDYNPNTVPETAPDFSKGWLTRLFFTDEYPRAWDGLPILTVYSAGYAALPDDLADAALQLVKAKYFARIRDPKLRSENIGGAYEAQYWFASGPGSDGQFPADVQAIIDRYRVPTIA